MVTVTETPLQPSTADRHLDRREQLEEAGRFRLEQIAALERELAGAPTPAVRRALLIAARTALREIEAALDRMASGAYGRCVTCAGTIPDARLDAVPMTAQCLPCDYNHQNCHVAGVG